MTKLSMDSYGGWILYARELCTKKGLAIPTAQLCILNTAPWGNHYVPKGYQYITESYMDTRTNHCTTSISYLTCVILVALSYFSTGSGHPPEVTIHSMKNWLLRQQMKFERYYTGGKYLMVAYWNIFSHWFAQLRKKRRKTTHTKGARSQFYSSSLSTGKESKIEDNFTPPTYRHLAQLKLLHLPCNQPAEANSSVRTIQIKLCLLRCLKLWFTSSFSFCHLHWKMNLVGYPATRDA